MTAKKDGYLGNPNLKPVGVQQQFTPEQVQEYFTALDTTIELLRQDTSDSYLQNQIDGVIELVRSTLYKLKYLK